MSKVGVPLGVDPGQARVVASHLETALGNGEEAVGAVRRLCELAELDPSSALSYASAATELLDATANLLRLKADQIEHADAGWPDIGEDGWVAGALRALTNVMASCPRPAPLDGACIDRPGDPGGTLDIEERLKWINEGLTPEERGRAAMALALELAYDDCVTAPDEFLTVDLGNNNYIVILPGVTDLSNAASEPGKFFYGDPQHQTARATWVAALRSSLSSDVYDNLYARLVKEYIYDSLPNGANVSLVGHSFGADTALDLASDPALQERVNITHVVAAGYHSEPQLPITAGDTEVLAFQNRNDAVVIGESLLDEPIRAGAGAYDVYDGARNGDLDLMLEGTKDFGKGLFGTVWDAVTWNIEGGGIDPRQPVGTTEHGPGQTNVVFDGDLFPGFGHHQDHYIGFVESDPAARDMAISLGETYGGDGELSAVDVTLRGR